MARKKKNGKMHVRVLDTRTGHSADASGWNVSQAVWNAERLLALADQALKAKKLKSPGRPRHSP